VPASVLVARNRQQTTYPVPGTIFKGNVPSGKASREEALARLERIDTTFDRQN